VPKIEESSLAVEDEAERSNPNARYPFYPAALAV
jgi:hypothetical protein